MNRPTDQLVRSLGKRRGYQHCFSRSTGSARRQKEGQLATQRQKKHDAFRQHGCHDGIRRVARRKSVATILGEQATRGRITAAFSTCNGRTTFANVESEFKFARCIRQGRVEAPTRRLKLVKTEKRTRRTAEMHSEIRSGANKDECRITKTKQPKGERSERNQARKTRRQHRQARAAVVAPRWHQAQAAAATY